MKGRKETNSHPIPCSPKDEEHENGDKIELNIFEVEEHENGDKIELSSSTICEMSPDKSEGYDIASLFNTCIMDFDISEIFSN
jgi:hypothetical protein